MIPKTQHPDVLFCEEPVSFFVPGTLIGKAVSAAVKLDGQACDCAEKIQKISATRILAAKFEFSEVATPEQGPQFLFSVSRFFSQIACKIASGCSTRATFAVLWCAAPPHHDG